jgi:CHASE3 domain sensor protein
MNASRQRSALLALAMVLGAVVANALISYLNIERLRKSDFAVRRSYDVITELQAVLTAVIDAETGQRGYLVTADRTFLKPYETALARLDEEFDRLENLVATDTAQMANLDELRKLAQLRLTRLKDSLAAHDEMGPASAQQLIRLGIGKQAMDQVRAKVHEMESLERIQLARRAGDAQTAYWTAITTGFFAAILSLCLAGAAYLLVVRDVERRVKAAADLQAANERLEERVR